MTFFESIYNKAQLVRFTEAKAILSTTDALDAFSTNSSGRRDIITLVNGKKNVPRWILDLVDEGNLDSLKRYFDKFFKCMPHDENGKIDKKSAVNEAFILFIKKSTTPQIMEDILSESGDALKALALTGKSQWVKSLETFKTVMSNPWDKDAWSAFEKESLDTLAKKKARHQGTLSDSDKDVLYETVYEDAHWGLYIPKSFEGDSELASHLKPFNEGDTKTHWCTAADKSYFDQYSFKGKAPLYVIKHFENGEYVDAWQIAFMAGTHIEIMDKMDERKYIYLFNNAPKVIFEELKNKVPENTLPEDFLYQVYLYTHGESTLPSLDIPFVGDKVSHLEDDPILEYSEVLGILSLTSFVNNNFNLSLTVERLADLVYEISKDMNIIRPSGVYGEIENKLGSLLKLGKIGPNAEVSFLEAITMILFVTYDWAYQSIPVEQFASEFAEVKSTVGDLGAIEICSIAIWLFHRKNEEGNLDIIVDYTKSLLNSPYYASVPKKSLMGFISIAVNRITKSYLLDFADILGDAFSKEKFNVIIQAIAQLTRGYKFSSKTLLGELLDMIMSALLENSESITNYTNSEIWYFLDSYISLYKIFDKRNTEEICTILTPAYITYIMNICGEDGVFDIDISSNIGNNNPVLLMEFSQIFASFVNDPAFRVAYKGIPCRVLVEEFYSLVSLDSLNREDGITTRRPLKQILYKEAVDKYGSYTSVYKEGVKVSYKDGKYNNLYYILSFMPYADKLNDLIRKLMPYVRDRQPEYEFYSLTTDIESTPEVKRLIRSKGFDTSFREILSVYLESKGLPKDFIVLD